MLLLLPLLLLLLARGSFAAAIADSEIYIRTGGCCTV
jgi:hypothetical protein